MAAFSTFDCVCVGVFLLTSAAFTFIFKKINKLSKYIYHRYPMIYHLAYIVIYETVNKLNETSLKQFKVWQSAYVMVLLFLIHITTKVTVVVLLGMGREGNKVNYDP